MSKTTHPFSAQIALLTDRPDGPNCNENGGTTYFTRSFGSIPIPPFFQAPALLIQKIYETQPVHARRILRNRIFTNVSSSESLQGIVKVAAKRITTHLLTDSLELQMDSSRNVYIDLSGKPEFNSLDISQIGKTGEWMSIALGLVINATQSKRYLNDRPVAALLVSKDHELLGAALNTNAQTRTQHAEMNLLQDHYAKTRSPLPRGATLYTTLKPCKMCAGMIHDFKSGELRVLYANDDPGTQARMTALDRINPPIQFKL